MDRPHRHRAGNLLTGPERPSPTLAYAALGACAALVIGAFGAWIDQSVSLGNATFERSLAGTSGGRDGVVIIVLALIAAGLVVFHLRASRPPLWASIAAGVLALLALVIVIADIGDIGDTPTLSAGWGIWLDLLAAIALLVLCVLIAMAVRSAPSPAAAPLAAGPQAPASAAPAATVPAGWYEDPSGRFRLRWWDGTAWTDHTSA